MASSLLCLGLLLFSLHAADGFEFYYLSRCVFNSTEMKDIEFILSYYYNKLEVNRFSSSLGRFVGYTEYGVRNAEFWNNLPGELPRWREEKEMYCLHNVRTEYDNILYKSVEPTVRLYSITPPAGRHPNMLVCSVYDFYPKAIRVTWLRDGREVTAEVTSTEEMEDGDWYYQLHSHLEYTPKYGEKISCQVEHASLKEPLIIEWNPSLTDSDRNKVAIGASGLILGLVLSLAGFMYYKRKARGRILVPSN